MNLNYFKDTSFISALKQFFRDDLHLPIHYLADEPAKPHDILGDESRCASDIKDVYALGMVDDAAFGEGKSTFTDLNEVKNLQKDYDGILLFGVTLKPRKDHLLPARGMLAEITRAFNREFHSTPVVVVFRYEHYIAFANCERGAYKQSWRDGEKAGKVSLLRDIDIDNVHAGHERILKGLNVPDGTTTFDALYKHWQQALNVSLLNKDFYRDLSNWFFAAKDRVTFPDPDDNAAQRGLIRLITRLIFTWFVKERGLVPEDLFDPDEFKKLLKDSNAQSDTYYRAILQNLFFATLNTEMGTRRFRDNKRDGQNRNKDYAIHSVFRYESTFTDPQKWKNLIENVPFLNGGLFECLDPEDKDGARVDGFSDVESRQAKLPNSLFWGDDFNADLSEVLNDKRQKTVKVKPLLNLLHSYKFTIAENTPLEEDVALDPELLGKVFENLLASYNPETSTTARKQTGSFYTPREIVNYMVEEALSAYLEPHASDKDSLKVLLSDTDSRSAQDLKFTPAQIETLVNAINHCTILDPACGSGAFPMGALSKMVMLLGKLDPQNDIWLNSQLAAVDKALEAVSATSADIDEAKKAVREAFHNNDPDYARKLYLIQRCLFGVDIQPVALQITKLRFFIALIIDQKIDWQKRDENFNIRALPNLETKFVAANTLIALPQSGSTLFDTAELQAHKDELFAKRRQHIAPKNRREKKQLEHDDKKLRALIKQELLDLRFDEDGATLIAEYDPYDQNATAPFFDPEWMFGADVKDGFDIVIGNPPYINIEKISAKDKVRYIEAYGEGGKLGKRYDIYQLFIMVGVRSLRTDGVLSFILPNTFLMGSSYVILRRLITNQTSILQVVDLPQNVFESATVDNVLIFLRRGNNPNNQIRVNKLQTKSSLERIRIPDWDASFIIPQRDLKPDNDYKINVHVTPKLQALFEKIQTNTTKLGDITRSSQGIILYKTQEDAEANLYTSFEQRKGWKKLLRGTNIGYYCIKWGGEYVKYGNWLWCARTEEYFSQPKILLQAMRNKALDRRLVATYDDQGYYNAHNLANIISKSGSGFDLKYILAIFNSKLINHWYKNHFPNVNINPNDFRQIPVYNATPAEQEAIASLVEQILAAKAADPAADTSALEREIDILVADLYGLDDAERKLVRIE